MCLEAKTGFLGPLEELAAEVCETETGDYENRR